MGWEGEEGVLWGKSGRKWYIEGVEQKEEGGEKGVGVGGRTEEYVGREKVWW